MCSEYDVFYPGIPKKLVCVCGVCTNIIGDRTRTDIKTNTKILCVCSYIVKSNHLCCFADMDSCCSAGAQWRFLLWFCAPLQCSVCDLQSPNQPCGGGNTPDVTASLLHNMCSHYCDSSVTQVHTPTPKYNTENSIHF